MTTGAMAIVSIPPGPSYFVSGNIDGLENRRGDQATPVSTLTGAIDFTLGRIVLSQTLTTSDGRGQISFDLAADFENARPSANAGPDLTVECVAGQGRAGLLGRATDPDGVDDVTSFAWSVELADRTARAAGAEAELTLPLGSHTARLVVSDNDGSSGTDTTHVDVVDTEPPVFDRVVTTSDCLWPPNHQMYLFRLGDELTATATDACEATTSHVRIIDVRSNQPADDHGDGSTAPDVRFGSGALCVRAERQGRGRGDREYTVVLEATDTQGNASQEEVVIRVPHDMGSAGRCATGGLVPAVDDDDPRCTADAPPPSASAPRAGETGDSTATCSVSRARDPHGFLFIVIGMALLLALGRRRP